jgi:hypothetical protein
LIKRIIRLLAVTALVVLALALPAFAQEEQTCYDRNGDGTYRCGGKLFGPLNEASDVNDEYPTPWDIGDEGYGYPWDIGDESDDNPPWDMGDEIDGDPPWDYGYPTLGSGDEYCDEESESYDEELCEDLQEGYLEGLEEGDWEDYWEAWNEATDYYGYSYW